MSEPNSKLFKDDPATYYTQLGAQAERERIIKDFKAACRCNGEQTEGYFCEADWAIKIVNEFWKGEQK